MFMRAREKFVSPSTVVSDLQGLPSKHEKIIRSYPVVMTSSYPIIMTSSKQLMLTESFNQCSGYSINLY